MLNTISEPEVYQVDWPGWPLSGNKFGDEFDEDARIRMIKGSDKLIPYIIKRNNLIGQQVLEIGPFFNPLFPKLLKRELVSKEIELTFLENDPYAIRWLKESLPANMLELDINTRHFREQFHAELHKRHAGSENVFSAIILSQVLNYVDYNILLQCLFPVLKRGGVIFINNVIDYGLPPLFSEKRPGSDIDIIINATQNGFIVSEADVLMRSNQKEKSDRLILVLSKI